MSITPQQYQALCVVIDAVKTDERSEDTDMYASRILDALNLTIERTQAMTLGGHHTPDQLLKAVEDGGPSALDAMHGILADIQDSYTKAMKAHGASEATVNVVTATVSDYITNHYGDN